MSEMNHETKMVMLWFGERMQYHGVDAIRDEIEERLDELADSLPAWAVDLTRINFVADQKVDWQRLVDLYGRNESEAQWLSDIS